MKRSAIIRRARLKRRTALASASNLRRARYMRRVTADADKLARRRAAQFGLQANLCRMLSCSVRGCPMPSEPHHDPVRSMGGTDEDACPLCRQHHSEWHDTLGRSEFARRYGFDTRWAAMSMRQMLVWLFDRGFILTTESASIDPAVRDEWIRRREQIGAAA